MTEITNDPHAENPSEAPAEIPSETSSETSSEVTDRQSEHSESEEPIDERAENGQPKQIFFIERVYRRQARSRSKQIS